MRKTVIFLLEVFIYTADVCAQSAADKIIGVYSASLSRNDAKIKAFKYKDGYRMQIFWLKTTKNPDGSLKTDQKNPDVSNRQIPRSEVVLVDKVSYEDGLWKNGQIYDPSSGKTYKVELKLKDAKTLEVKGKLGPFYKCMYWTKEK